MKVYTDYQYCHYVTPGKRYEYDEESHSITCDDGDRIIIYIEGCCHLDEEVWKVDTTCEAIERLRPEPGGYADDESGDEIE